jgi:hypothetical protein
MTDQKQDRFPESDAKFPVWLEAWSLKLEAGLTA